MNDTNSQYLDYSPPLFLDDGFHCPHCGIYSHQLWFRSAIIYIKDNFQGDNLKIRHFHYAYCSRCEDISIWREKELIYPQIFTAPRPHKDLPTDILTDYNEARSIFNFSPKGSAALLRLATEKLVKILIVKSGNKDKGNLNDNIGILVTDGLPQTIQQALDSLRVIGNNAVHPGLIDLNDDKDTALKLFKTINVIIENRITQIEEIATLFQEKIPELKKAQIEKRDEKIKEE